MQKDFRLTQLSEEHYTCGRSLKREVNFVAIAASEYNPIFITFEEA